MNIVILKGNITRDPENKKIQSGDKQATVTNFTLAVNRHFKKTSGERDKETTYIDCEAWDSGAETIAKYVKKGDPLLIKGSLKQDTWEVDGQKRSRIKIRVSEFELLYRSPNKDNSSDTDNSPPNPGNDPSIDGSEIPF